MSETMVIRTAGPSDREAMLAMYRGFDPLGAAQGLPPVTEEGRRAWIDRLLKEASHWGAFDPDGRLLGRITIDDVVDVIREEADHSVLSMADLDEDEDMFAAVLPSARRRAIWLGVNLATAVLAANVVGLFDVLQPLLV